ncbi:fatty acid desaturase [Thiotrichales bacterium 19S9-12]|nr:fatty acid desaturase [Thiotrichales bacterium 19S9-11]MCF6810779.1 fatty acid desaturase [Thiotrichales bacterium 19S9-12]
MDPHFWKTLIRPYTKKSNLIASKQVINTLLPLLTTWIIYFTFYKTTILTLIICSVISSLLLLRCFILMHDCGHNSLFKSKKLNNIFGFLFGVITGMPQYVWSSNHAFHHKTNGDWDSYCGPLNIITTTEFGKLNDFKRFKYTLLRNPIFFPIGGFFYLLFNPRYNWIKDSTLMILYIIKYKFKKDSKIKIRELIKQFPSRSWKNMKEYKHQSLNNLMLISIWIVVSIYLGAYHFFILYIISASIGGGIGILLFTVQHNFEHAYASNKENWNYYKGAIEGSSFLILPPMLNWITANIAYHHIHHLSCSIPNYQLAKCHDDQSKHFKKVKRIHLNEVLHSLKYILWDRNKQMLISIKDYKQIPSNLN